MPRNLGQEVRKGSVNILAIAGVATLLTFASGIVIFAVERLGLYTASYLTPFAFLTPGETLLLLFFAEWFIYFVLLLVVYGLVARK